MSKTKPSQAERRPIANCPGYMIDMDGVVWSPRGKAMRTKINEGYRRVRLRVKGKDSQHYVGVLVLEAFVGARPGPGYAVRYLDQDTSNCRLSNLEWSLNSANASIPIADFVRAWQGSKSVREVCEKTGLAYQACVAKKQSLITRGVPLKRMPRERVDWDEIAKLAKELELEQ